MNSIDFLPMTSQEQVQVGVEFVSNEDVYWRRYSISIDYNMWARLGQFSIWLLSLIQFAAKKDGEEMLSQWN